MKPEDIEKQYKKFLSEINKEAAEAQKAAAKNNSATSLAYNDQYRFFEQKEYIEEFSLGGSPTSIIEMIKIFEEEVAQHKNKLDFRTGFDGNGCGYEDDDSLEWAGMKATWKEPRAKNNDRFLAMAKERTKSWVAQKIKEHKNITDNRVGIYIDCKILELFKNGSIDFETLCTITLSNCKL